MIHALIFDCFGVLYSEGRREIDALAPPHLKSEMNDLYLQSDYGYITREEFLAQLAAMTGLDVERLSLMIEQHYVRNEPLIDFVRTMKGRYKVGMLSNVGDDFVESLFSEAEREALFDDIVLSSNVGLLKPSAEIYELAAQRLGVLPEECVFIDDRPVNVEAARYVGMKGVTYTAFPQLKTDMTKLLEQFDA
ncbi:HAD-superfamily hydrolase, subfamily IA, variant 3 [Candidatus Saccharibacteria bacterium RAAC3_TM7_1]|nr:HAD-superfamily hydrolase, subfamily IA, variant 3 [Candidatus Saccharibacteria bacterium RAAC3_TM7_1]HCZ28708.1 HAD family phosphatase [Candidatus Saccharibacteria bacterium]